MESEAGLEPGGSPPGMGGIHLGGMNSRDLGGIVVGRGFKIEVNKSDDSLLDERRGAVRLDEMRGNMFSHGR